LLAIPERAVSLKIFHLLTSHGFSASNPKLYPLLLKVFWLLLLTRGKAIVLLGFAIYVAFAPLALAWNLFFYIWRRVKGLPKPIVEAPVLTWEEKQFAKSSSSGLLICGIALWIQRASRFGIGDDRFSFPNPVLSDNASRCPCRD
jgi:hypothetical protein